MIDRHCKIGKVTPKHLNVVPHPALTECRELGDELRSHADTIASTSPRLGGYAIVSWQLDGHYNRVLRYHSNSPIGITQAPSFVHDVLGRLTAADVVHDVLNNRQP